ncbi:aldose 1-epimerase family protein [Alkalicella caledoniensis]|uniref:aldose 1-epimerase family protein n=1 Tax=Alkalicella caledoniensis TaxID=2731377 RepID=UPI001FE9BE3D|nr:aldose 1-epimerase family protein [Alkalicella caledoniensis]
MITLENEKVVVRAKSQGAELTSILLKEDNTEYLWQGNPKFWARHAPILFPIVGKLVDNTCCIDNKTYNMSQHGFARDMEFEVISQSDTEVVFVLNSSEETLRKYPYFFDLRVIYKVINNDIVITYIVKNTGSEDMYFSIGAHPAFNWPFGPDGIQDGYYLEFEQAETIGSRVLNEGVISNNVAPVLNNQNIIQLDTSLFKDDALILQGLNSNKVSIKTNSSRKSVTVDFNGFPYLGIWSKPEGAPFVCIEPWFGIADTESSTGNIKEKEGILRLNPGKEFSCEYKITVK